MMHAWLLQFTVSVTFPGHASPPFAGSGFEQVLVFIWKPPPQVLEHVVKADQLLQPPSIFKLHWNIDLQKQLINKTLYLNNVFTNFGYQQLLFKSDTT